MRILLVVCSLPPKNPDVVVWALESPCCSPEAQDLKGVQKLLTMPGIVQILGLTIMLEVGHIDRFPTVGDYSSY